MKRAASAVGQSIAHFGFVARLAARSRDLQSMPSTGQGQARLASLESRIRQLHGSNWLDRKSKCFMVVGLCYRRAGGWAPLLLAVPILNRDPDRLHCHSEHHEMDGSSPRPHATRSTLFVDLSAGCWVLQCLDAHDRSPPWSSNLDMPAFIG